MRKEVKRSVDIFLGLRKSYWPEGAIRGWCSIIKGNITMGEKYYKSPSVREEWSRPEEIVLAASAFLKSYSAE